MISLREAKHLHWKYPREYMAWLSAKTRCYNRHAPQYRNYGARGIRVAKEWRHDFARFYADMGPRPAETQLDRIDNNGPYAPGNCRWSTTREQSLNRRTNHLLTWNGITLPAVEWSARLGIKKTTLLQRLYMGWTVERALATPVSPYRYQHK